MNQSSWKNTWKKSYENQKKGGRRALKWKGIQTHERRQERRLGGTGEKTGIGDETGAEPWRGDETGTTGKEKKFKVAMEH